MKYLSLIIILLITLSPLFGQTVNVWQNPCNSATIPEQIMLINVDIDSLNLDSCITRNFYSTDGQESWNESEMTLLTELNYTTTFEDTILLPDSGRVFYGFKTIYPTYIDTIFDTLFYTMSAKNIDDIFPPTDNFLTELCEEKIGDAYQATEKPYLDLTEIKISFSDDKFYCSLDNNDSEWPLYESLPCLPPWYVYGFGFYNPESTDSVGYAMVYADIPTMNVTPGLYKVNTDSTFSRIGDIDYQIQNEKLYMACNIDTLTSDPQFGPWPNESGGLICGAGTLTINAYPFVTLNDRSHPCIFYPTIFQQDIGINELPQLSELTFYTVSDTIVFNITYSDSSNNLPVVRKLIIENKTEFNFISSDHYYQDGSEFIVSIPFPQSFNTAYAKFSDGADTVQSNVITFVGIDENNAELIGIQLSNYPNPFNTSTTISFNLATDLHGLPRIKIYNVKGRLVKEFKIQSPIKLGIKFKINEVVWDGSDEKGKQMPNGIYFYKLSIKNSPVKKMLLLR